MSYSPPDNQHFFMAESIPACKVAVGACGDDISYRVTDPVVEPVAANSFRRSAICAWLSEYFRQQESWRYFRDASFREVDLFVRRCNELRASFIGFPITANSLLSLLALSRRMVTPSLGTPISADLSGAKTTFAFVRQPKRALAVTIEKLSRSRKFAFASEASPETVFRVLNVWHNPRNGVAIND